MCRHHGLPPQQQPHLGLNLASASVVAAVAGPRRNLIPQGLERFTQGPLPSQALVEQISPSVTCILGLNPSSFTLNGTNIYLVGTGRRRVLIDAGERSEKTSRVIALLEQVFADQGVDGLDEIICTHLHHDHVGGAEAIQRRFGPCRVSKFPSPESEIVRREKQVEQEQLRLGLSSTTIPDSMRLVQQGIDFERRPYHRLQEGELISTQGASLRILHTPGHAPDHVVIVLEEERAVFTGDHVLGWGTSWVEDLGDYVSSLHKIANLSPLRLYPGHGPCVMEALACLNRYLSHREQRERQVLGDLQSSFQTTTLELVNRLYPSTAKHDPRAVGNVEKILIKLQNEGIVVQLPHSEWRLVGNRL
ncbi:hypothetical protein BASA81_015052 [Batrachochytrium salamandrivorans]|nr:hypothetical protein BASA81_015052 [Batrachochytrium salamandrivorans]